MTSQLALVFPGQGSQSVGMLFELSETYPSIKKTFDEASEVLAYDLWQLSQEGPEDKLNQTEFTQAALLTVGVAVFRVLHEEATPSVSMMGGHSLGEYTALVCAGSLSFQDAVQLVSKRGQFMQAAVPKGQGAMAAIVGLDNELVEKLCQQAAEGQVLSPANFNSLGQIVVAGETDAINRVVKLAEEAGARLVKKLEVSVPSHCALMKTAADQLAKELSRLKIESPKVPVINNVSATICTHPDDIRQALVEQLYQPVQWVKLIQSMHQEGINLLFEVGPGRVLTGLNKRIERGLKTYPIYDSASLQFALDAYGKQE